VAADNGHLSVVDFLVNSNADRKVKDEMFEISKLIILHFILLQKRVIFWFLN